MVAPENKITPLLMIDDIPYIGEATLQDFKGASRKRLRDKNGVTIFNPAIVASSNFDRSAAPAELVDDHIDVSDAESSDATGDSDDIGTLDPLPPVRSKHCLLHRPPRKDCFVCLCGKIARMRQHRRLFERVLKSWGQLITVDHIVMKGWLGLVVGGHNDILTSSGFATTWTLRDPITSMDALDTIYSLRNLVGIEFIQVITPTGTNLCLLPVGGLGSLSNRPRPVIRNPMA